jgi:hypothetical protein
MPNRTAHRSRDGNGQKREPEKEANNERRDRA